MRSGAAAHCRLASKKRGSGLRNIIGSHVTEMNLGSARWGSKIPLEESAAYPMTPPCARRASGGAAVFGREIHVQYRNGEVRPSHHLPVPVGAGSACAIADHRRHHRDGHRSIRRADAEGDGHAERTTGPARHRNRRPMDRDTTGSRSCRRAAIRSPPRPPTS